MYLSKFIALSAVNDYNYHCGAHNYHCGVQQLELTLWCATIRINIVVCNN